MKKIFLLLAVSLFSMHSFSQEKRQEKRQGQKPPTIDELFTQMDANNDGKLSKKEVKGPIKDDFAKIDLNKDGFLTKEELEKAPKPERPNKPAPPQRD